ncbi:hypothetical protein CFOL_v3_31200 [Cephalotus follicularis]|uniref:Secreted protein n=1 Tax=Cephalotus follicularis TaxID=3775 RepID=A0A1Q3D5R9_CEPFO|nr:hypothetical protein CFOL_v3_31200 [Cephalotus follicularis]
MKFLLQMVSSCCCLAVTSSQEPPFTTTRRNRRRRIKRENGSDSISGEWKPSLVAISEDNIVTETRNQTTAGVGPAKIVKRETGSHVKVRSSSDYYRQDTLPTVIPAFPPIPFMF